MEDRHPVLDQIEALMPALLQRMVDLAYGARAVDKDGEPYIRIPDRLALIYLMDHVLKPHAAKETTNPGAHRRVDVHSPDHGRDRPHGGRAKRPGGPAA